MRLMCRSYVIPSATTTGVADEPLQNTVTRVNEFRTAEVTEMLEGFAKNVSEFFDQAKIKTVQEAEQAILTLEDGTPISRIINEVIDVDDEGKPVTFKDVWESIVADGDAVKAINGCQIASRPV